MKSHVMITVTCCLTLWSPELGAAELDRHLPDDTKVVLSFKVRETLESTLLKKKLAKEFGDIIDQDPRVKAILTNLEFDPRKDIDRIVIAANSVDRDNSVIQVFESIARELSGDGARPRGNGQDLMILYGKFKGDKIRKVAKQAAKDELLKIHKVGDHELYETADAASHLFLCVPDDTTLLASSSRRSLTEALDRRAGTKKSKPSKTLSALIESVDDKQQLWFAIDGSGTFIPDLLSLPYIFRGKPDDLKDTVTSVIGGFTLAGDMGIDFTINTKDEKSAKIVERHLRGGLNILIGLASFGDMNLERDELAVLAELFKSGRFTRDGTTIRLKGILAAKQVDEIMKN